MRKFWKFILIMGFFALITDFIFAQEVPNLQNSSWMWSEKGMSVEYSFGPANEAAARIILTENNSGFQISKANCHFYVPFTYEVKGDLLYASLPGRKEAQASKVSFVPGQKLQIQEVAYFVKTYSEISGEREENILETPQFLEKVKIN